MDSPLTILAFDFGMKRIGVAVGQSITATANPLPVLQANQGTPDWAQIEKLIQQYAPQQLVVGLPLQADGSAYEVTERAQRFGRRLHGRYQLPVDWIDERLSSHEAENYLKEQKSAKVALDSMAAKIIAEDWMAHQAQLKAQQ